MFLKDVHATDATLGSLERVRDMPSRLLQTLGSLPRKNRNSSLAVFQSLRAEIIEARREHWTLDMIWDALQVEGRFPFSFTTFRRLTRQHLPKRGAKGTPTKGARAFVFNPVANPDELF